jgi:hypothetical protein
MYQLIRSGEIPADRRSGRWWVRRADLDASLDGMSVERVTCRASRRASTGA